MPVSRTSAWVLRRSNAGGLRWMGSDVSAPMGPFPSMGSPITLMTRPRVLSPTGAWMNLPVSRTSSPRESPSEESMAMGGTTLSPRCRATSRTRLSGRSEMDGLVVTSAWRMGGRLPSSKATSTTGPRTWMILPLAVVVLMGCRFLSDGLRAGDDLDQLGGDLGLACPVLLEGILVNHFLSIARRVVHRGHARALFARRVFQERVEHEEPDGLRDQLGQKFGRRRIKQYRSRGEPPTSGV